ncbi:MAG: hypothetical protein LBR88_08170 [Zoogloeaceae bacterium]|nr:hypothetical protein [Zoogloeaceae bacterium]
MFYEDRVSTPGRIFVTTLDPCYHHGSRFMPAASRLLRGFLPWLARQCDGRCAQRRAAALAAAS